MVSVVIGRCSINVLTFPFTESESTTRGQPGELPPEVSRAPMRLPEQIGKAALVMAGSPFEMPPPTGSALASGARQVLHS